MEQDEDFRRSQLGGLKPLLNGFYLLGDHQDSGEIRTANIISTPLIIRKDRVRKSHVPG